MIIDRAPPTNWRSKRLKSLATYNDEVLPEATDDDTEIDYVEISGVSLTKGIEEVNRIPFYQAPSRARRKVRPGDILVSTVRTYLKAIAAVGDGFGDDLIASTGFCVIRPGDEMDSGYLGWVAKSEPFVGEVVARSVGVSYPAINASDLVDIRIPLPPKETQQRIARFLDEKIARIDAMIEKKQALLERLAEKRQALITRVVTKGLNLNAPMKPSGVEWLGDIPVHWDVLPLRRSAMKVATGRTPPSIVADYFTDGTINWFTPGDFGESLELRDSERKIIQKALDDGVSTAFPKGTVFLVGIGATLGKVAVATASGAANQQINAIALQGRDSPYFLAYFLHGFREQVRLVSNGNTLGILNQEGTKSLLVVRPPANEQEQVARFLVEQDRGYANLVCEVHRSIRLLADYRASMITAAVTGQLPELGD
jgi:type I restriction enzyme, S subunit